MILQRTYYFVLILLTGIPNVSSKKSIPSSKQTYLYNTSPAWNHSPQIDNNGFLSKLYSIQAGKWEKEARIGGKYGYKSLHTRNMDQLDVVVRQVPGDGNCLFHSLSTALSWAEDRVHLDFDQSVRSRSRSNLSNHKESSVESKNKRRDEDELDLYARSAILRQIAVDMLNPDDMNDKKPRTFIRYGRQRQKPLFLQGSEFLRPDELLEVACSQYSMTGKEYCESMRNNGVWGGGPEIVALCNYLKRPIHVYELMTMRPKLRLKEGRSRRQKQQKDKETETEGKPEFRLRRMACFGSPKFDYREPLHILSADCRFPDILPGQQASAGNHFMAMFPEKRSRRRGDTRKVGRASIHTRQGVRVRSGARSSRSRTCRTKNESTFSKRDVVSKYLTAVAGPNNPNNASNGFFDRMANLFAISKFDDNKLTGAEVEAMNDKPLQEIMRWCNAQYSALRYSLLQL